MQVVGGERTAAPLCVAIVRPKIVLIFFRNPNEKTQRPIHSVCVWKRAGDITQILQNNLRNLWMVFNSCVCLRGRISGGIRR